MWIHRALHGLAATLPLLAILAGCGDSTGPGEIAPLIRQSAHFEFRSNTELAAVAEIEFGIRQAEADYAAISDLVGAARLPDRMITVILEGDKRSGRAGGYIDEEGTVHLSRYGDNLGGYFGALAHEVAHAVRYDYWQENGVGGWENFGFIEEGFAEFIAVEVHPGKSGFPYYGYPEDVIAGHLLIRGADIPLQALRERHDELNSPCEWQAYPQRASWFRYIDETFGRDAVLSIAYAEVETTTQMIEGVLGVPVAQVDADWREWLLARYAAIPDADEVAAAYLDRFGNEQFCVEGVDY